MLPKEKEKLVAQFNDEKHHLVVAMNIFMFCCRHDLISIDAVQMQGKKFIWFELKLAKCQRETIQDVYNHLSKAQQESKTKPHLGSADANFMRFPLKHFCERFSSIKHLALHPKDIKKYSKDVAALCNPKIYQDLNLTTEEQKAQEISMLDMKPLNYTVMQDNPKVLRQEPESAKIHAKISVNDNKLKSALKGLESSDDD